MFREYSIYTAHNPDQTPSLQHLYYPCLVSTPYLLPISSQYTISSAHIHLVHHLSCPPVVSKPSLLPMSSKTITSTITSQNFTYSTHVQSEYHMFWSCPISTPSLLPLFYQDLSCPSPNQASTPSILSMSCQYTIMPADVQLGHHPFCPPPDSTPSYLAMSSQNTTSTVHVHALHHFYYSFPVSLNKLPNA